MLGSSKRVHTDVLNDALFWCELLAAQLLLCSATPAFVRAVAVHAVHVCLQMRARHAPPVALMHLVGCV